MQTLYLLMLAVLWGTYVLLLVRLRKVFTGLNPILGWIAGLGYFVIAPFSIVTLRGGFEYPAVYEQSGNWGAVDLSRPQFLGPWIFVWLALMLACVTAFLSCPAPGAPATETRGISPKRLERIVLFSMSLLLADAALTIYLNGGIEEFLISHWYHRQDTLIERFGVIYILYMHASAALNVLFVGAAALYAAAGVRGIATRRRITAGVIFFLLLGTALHGNRIFVALYLLAFLASCWLSGRKKLLIALAVASPVVILVFSAWAWVRQDLSAIPESVGTHVIEAEMDNRAVTAMMDATEGANVLLLMHIIGDAGTRYDYLYGSTYARLLTFFEPRILHPERTRSFTEIAASNYEPGEQMSLNSTALGEAAANFGLLGIFVAPLVTWLAARWSLRLAAAPSPNALLSTVAFLMFIWFARSTFAENAMTLTGAAILVRVFAFDKNLYAAEPQKTPVQISGGSTCWT